MLLDCTESLRVAAFFATRELPETPTDDGVIYVFDTNVLAANGIHILRPQCFPSAYTRIHATRSCFLQGWGRGEDYRPAQYFERGGGAPKYAGSVGLNDENPYTIEAQLSPGADQSGVKEFLFNQESGSFEDPAWNISADELGYGAGETIYGS